MGSSLPVRLRDLAIALACAACPAISLSAQEAAKAPVQGQIESDPIKCWWRAEKSAVRVGEPFTLDLTCGVIDTNQVKVVVDPNRLDPAALELTPFEVLGGMRYKDIESPPWRYFQYSYSVRIIGDEFFGKDVDLPAVQLTYNVQSAGGNGSPGRDQLYLLPLLPVRVQSLVPVTATDIRDESPETFADLEARRFRASAELAAGGILFCFALVFAGVAVARKVRGDRAPAQTVVHPLSSAAVLRSCARGGDRLKGEVASAGWSPDLIGRALTLLRIAGAVAMGRPVAQTPVEPDVPEREGQFVLRRGIVRPQRAVISASTTTTAIAAHLADGNGRVRNGRTAPVLEQIGDSLRVFGAARYSRNGHPDAAELDAALDRGIRAIRQLLVTKLWRARAADALAERASALRERIWSR